MLCNSKFRILFNYKIKLLPKIIIEFNKLEKVLLKNNKILIKIKAKKVNNPIILKILKMIIMKLLIMTIYLMMQKLMNYFLYIKLLM